MFAGPRSHIAGSAAGAGVASHYIAVGWALARNTGATSCWDLQTFAAAGTGGSESRGQCILIIGRQGQADHWETSHYSQTS